MGMRTTEAPGLTHEGEEGMGPERRRDARGGGSGPGRTGARPARPLLAAGVAAALAMTGCGDDIVDPGGDGGGSQPPPSASADELTFLRQSSDAPAFFRFDGDTSFVATRGEDTEIEIRYVDPSDTTQAGEEFLEFELEDGSLARYPDGTEFRPGDTVTITIRVTGDTILAEFEPSGLEFDPDEPAELEMHFGNADRDTDDDGEDDLDEREDEVRLWRQEQPGDDWLQFSEQPDVTLDRIRAELTSFTRFAMAI